MKIYGYKKRSEEVEGEEKISVELGEVGILITTRELKLLSRFFQKQAEQMEKYENHYGHEHFQFFLTDLPPEEIEGCDFGNLGVEPEITVARPQNMRSEE
jgi:hypothetical protein